jgi:L-lactate dehydrogenase complex protein LldG
VTAREEVLGRIRAALSAPGSERPTPDRAGAAGEQRTYRRRGDLGTDAMLDLLADRLVDYRCSVRRCRPNEVPATIAAALAERGARRVVLPPDIDLPLPDTAGEDRAGEDRAGEDRAGEDTVWVVDDCLSAEALDRFDAVITTATVAIAETGTIVLDGSAGQGRRALTLIPDYHLCVVYGSQVVGLVPEAISALTPQRPLTWISGPSATSDIELDRVEGVHGPRTLEVILVNPG